MDQQQINRLNKQFEGLDAPTILQECANLFGDKIAFASSLGYEDQVITHLIAATKPAIKIFTLDTGRLFPETYDLISKVNARYKLKIQVYFPEHKAVENMVNEKGINLFYDSIDNRKLCCNIRKTKPLQRALNNLDAWITGLRRSQSITRNDMQIVEWDKLNNMIKINPLLEWSEDDVKHFIHDHKVPYNVLHDKGFPSIGCQPCTRAIQEGEDIRAGRWWWELPEQKECGLHK
jgi:phosphoadenosine phosphosulfate reductase